MANFSFLKPTVNEAVRRNLDGTYLAQSSAASPFVAPFHPASPYTRLACSDVFDKIQHQRTTYTVQNADINSPWLSGEWGVNWDDPMADAAYTCLVAVSDPNYSANSPVMTPPSVLVTSKTASGVRGRLSFFPFGFGVGRALTIEVSSWHD